jgi:hypothetical protein
MDWSPESVLDFRARTHRRGLRWRQKKEILWPVRAFRVTAAEPKEGGLNPIQLVVLRLYMAGCRQIADAAELLGIESELLAYVSRELVLLGLLDEHGCATQRVARFLEEAELDPGDLRVGWVFQDTYSGQLLPRFVETLPLANCERDTEGRPLVTVGPKGRPRSERAFVVPDGDAPTVVPSPRDILEAILRHRRHQKRHVRAGIEVGVDMRRAQNQITCVSEFPERMHLLTFAYVPEEVDDDLPWYVAEPFGFGASPELRAQLDKLSQSASGSFRTLLDGITGAALDHHRDQWNQMQLLLREEAKRRVSGELPRGAFAGDAPVRDALENSYLELARLEQANRSERPSERDFDLAYLRIRQALEVGLQLCRTRHPPGDAWRKLTYLPRPDRSPQGLPADVCRKTILACADQVGFAVADFPRAIVNAKWGQVQWACTQELAGGVRPAVVALLLACATDICHPLRQVAALQPRWLHEVDHIAQAAGGQVHAGRDAGGLGALISDANQCATVLRTLMNALAWAQEAGHHRE